MAEMTMVPTALLRRLVAAAELPERVTIVAPDRAWFRRELVDAADAAIEADRLMRDAPASVTVPVGVLEQAGRWCDEAAEALDRDAEDARGACVDPEVVANLDESERAATAMARRLYAAARGERVDWDAAPAGDAGEVAA